MEGNKAVLSAILQRARALQQKLEEEGPQTKEQLHAWVKKEIGVDIPNRKVCPDHDAPMDFLWDLFAEKVGSALLMANRGGSKTFIVAVLHYANSTFKPGCESLSAGATQAQSDRCYEHLTKWVYEQRTNPDGSIESVLKPELIKSIDSRTTWKRGSKVEIIPGTKKAVNGPHPQKAHIDEVEQFDDEAWAESRNMAISKSIQLPDGTTREILAQDILTSTRKSAKGRMQKLLDECTQAEKDGLKPPYRVYKWCVFETAAAVPNCRTAPENEGRPEEELCDCNLVASDRWPARKGEKGKQRTLDQVCKGRFYHGPGWRPLEEIQNTFQQNDRNTWEAQQECSKPSVEGNYIPQWDEREHTVRDYIPDPDNGDIFMSVDWGGTNPHAVNWYQLLDFEIEVIDFNNDTIRLPEGSLVCFDEIYVSEIGATALADRVIARERYWREKFGKFPVRARFADPQGKMARMDFRAKGLYTEWYTTRDFDYQVQRVKDLFKDDLFRVDLNKCEVFIEEIEVWRADPKTGNQIDEFNHCMSNFRYAVANIHMLKREDAKRGRGKRKAAHRDSTKVTASRKTVRYDRKGRVGMDRPSRSDHYPNNYPF